VTSEGKFKVYIVLSLVAQRKNQRKCTTGHNFALSSAVAEFRRFAPQPPPATQAGPDGPPAAASDKFRTPAAWDKLPVDSHCASLKVAKEVD